MRRENLHYDNWFVAQTKNGRELWAIANLERQQFRSFCPRLKKTRRHARRVETILSPLFPGYIFVQFDPQTGPWRYINATFGVRSLVCLDRKHPVPMPAKAMKQLFDRCENGVITGLMDTPSPGDAVKIVSGPLLDRLAIVESLAEGDRVRVLLDILGGKTSVSIGIDALVSV